MTSPSSATLAPPAAICLGLVPLLLLASATAQVNRQTPLHEPSQGNGNTLFTTLKATDTGLNFRYSWTPPERYDHEMVNAVTGGGACMGDYDGDGHIDIFLTQPFQPNRLYRNLGNWKFQDVTEAAGLSKEHLWGTGASFADTDNDGDLDLFVCGYDCPNRFYLNQGDGTFTENADAAGLAYQGASVMVAFADYNGDGYLDAYLCNNHRAPREAPLWKYEKDARGMPIVPDELKGIAKPLYRPDLQDGMLIPAGESDRLYRNNGDGTFTDVSAAAGIADEDFGLSATWWDFDHDGDPDLYNANDFYGADHLYRNNGDGTFTDVNQYALPHTPWFSMGSDVADINNDGLLDFMASDMLGTTHYKQKLSMGDMQGWFLETATPRQYMRNALYINTGELRFQEAAFLAGVASTDWTWSLKFADLDGDGRSDLYVTNGAERYWDHSDMMSSARGAQRLDTPELKRLWLNSPQRNDPNLAYRNLGDLHFQDVSKAWGLDAAKVSYGAALGDLDNDGDLDLVVNHFEDEASLYRNDSQTTGRASITLKGTGKSNADGLGALVKVETAEGPLQTHYHTLTRGFMSANAPGLVLGLGEATSFDVTVTWPSGVTQHLSGLRSGQHYHLQEASAPGPEEDPTSPPRFAISDALRPAMIAETPFDDFAREPLLPNKLSQLGPGMAWGDLDNDGDDDLVLGRPAGLPTAVYLTGPGRLDLQANDVFQADAGSEDMAPLLFDADRDGDLDLFVASGGVEAEPGSPLYQDRLYLNDGQGHFSRAPSGTLPEAAVSSSVAAAADVDRDGDLDLFVGTRVHPGHYPLSQGSRLLRNDDGRFLDVTSDRAPALLEAGLITSAVWSDADDDGWPDLLLTREWGSIMMLSNAKGSLTDTSEAAGLTNLSGWWNSIAAGDLNHDGAIDYVVGNTGLNSKYHADPSHPARLYYGDMDGSGRPQIIEAKAAEEGWLPVRGKSCSQNAIPALRERFPTFESFAKASLTDIYTPARLAGAQVFDAVELRSGILLNQGSGRFTFQPLPRLAQISPGFGAVITEIDGDGHPDIYLLQNSFSPQPETGRMDGGMSQLLLGTGDGGFVLEPVRHSGLIVSGDGKSLGAIDLNLDGWVDFAAACNSGPLPLFLNRGSNTHRPLSLRLRGPQGNPTAVGTRVTLTGEGMPSQTAEVAAGGGYLSQQPSMLFFGIPKGAAPQSLQVRWPDGKRSALSLTGSQSRRLLIQHPAAKP